MSLRRVATIARNIPRLLVPPIFGHVRSALRDRGRSRPEISDHHLYRPVYSPWLGDGDFGTLRDEVSGLTLVSPDRLWVLYGLATQALHLGGDFVECGVYRGGTARVLARLIEREPGHGATSRRLRLFDTFGGMPETDAGVDKHLEGDFADTSLRAVRDVVGAHHFVTFHQGRIPESFAEVSFAPIAFLHVDVDIYNSVLDTLVHLFDKVMSGGVVLFDDYGFESCYGARLAVDEFFRDRPEVPLILPTGQALVQVMPRQDGA